MQGNVGGSCVILMRGRNGLLGLGVEMYYKKTLDFLLIGIIGIKMCD